MAMRETASISRDNLFAANQQFPAVTDKMSIAASQTLKRGCLLDAAGNAVDSTSTTSGEGDSAVTTTTYAEVYAVLAEDITTSSSAGTAVVYLTGEFNAAALSAAEGETISNYKASARKVGIFIKSNG